MFFHLMIILIIDNLFVILLFLFCVKGTTLFNKKNIFQLFLVFFVKNFKRQMLLPDVCGCSLKQCCSNVLLLSEYQAESRYGLSLGRKTDATKIACLTTCDQYMLQYGCIPQGMQGLREIQFSTERYIPNGMFKFYDLTL